MRNPPRSIGELSKKLVAEALVLRKNSQWRPHTINETWVIYVAFSTRSLWIAHLPSGTKLQVAFDRNWLINADAYELSRNDRPLRPEDGEWAELLLKKAAAVRDDLTKG